MRRGTADALLRQRVPTASPPLSCRPCGMGQEHKAGTGW